MMPTTCNSHKDTLGSPLTVRLDCGDPEVKREEIRRYFHATFDVYEKLFEVLTCSEAFYQRADPLRHPLIFYYGHTAVFFVNKLVLGKYLATRIDPELERMCAIGVDEMSWDDLNDAHYDWPTVEAVTEYRAKVRAAVDALITEAPLTMPIGWDSPFWIIMMGIEHERIHLETSSVLIRQLPLDKVRPHPAWEICRDDHEAPENTLLPIPGDLVRMGKSRQSGLYGWDNEYGTHEKAVGDFKASRYLVSNREYLTFVEDGGYTEERFWSPEGWKWATYDKRGMPRFWRRDARGHYQLRCMLEEIAMPWSWPVETNNLEAEAFCRWKAAKTGLPIRLPTEEEWYRLHAYSGVEDVTSWESVPGNINLAEAASPVPVDCHAFGHGFHDVIGNVWQHTASPIAGFAGFEVHPLYDDFSTPTFDTKHNLIKGGSWISTGNEATRESRYAFRRHFYQHAGFRYIESDEPVVIPDDRYETDPDVVPYCELHYGAGLPGLVNYAEAIASFCLEKARDCEHGRALELGCKVGRTSFELAKVFDHVTGIDLSARTIRIGAELVEKGYTQWAIPSEGELVEYRQRHLGDFGLDEVRARVEFLQADPANMKAIHTGYDLILVNGLLEQSYQPGAFLRGVHERLKPGGLLVVASTCDWDASRTAKADWLGGYKDLTGENVFTIDGLRTILGGHFRQDDEVRELPMALRRHTRRYDYLIAQVTCWWKQ